MAQTAQQIIEELQDKLVTLNTEVQAIQAQADAEKRVLSEDEKKQKRNLMDLFDATEEEIGDRKRALEQESRIAKPQQRIVAPDLAADISATAAPQAGATTTTKRPARAIEQTFPNKGTGGFRSLGDFALTVVVGSAKGALPDQRLTNAATTLGSESAGGDGGFAVPPDFRSEIVQLIQGEDGLLGRTDQQVTSSNQITVPTDETTAWQSTGGIQAVWEGENAQLTQSKPKLQSVTVRAHKLTALVPVTDELLEDASSMANYLRRKTPEKINFKVNNAIVNGLGVGMPTGLMNAACKVSIAKDTNQTAGTVSYTNITGMWARMYAPYRRNAVWLINQDVEPQLQQMQLVSGSATTSLGFPAYMPPGGLSGAPYGTLMGRPVIVTEACATAGTEGDIILTDLSQYLSVVKGGGVRQDVSIHLWFDYDVTAFRWILRIGGQPWLSAAIARANGSNTLSSIVTCAVRS